MQAQKLVKKNKKWGAISLVVMMLACGTVLCFPSKLYAAQLGYVWGVTENKVIKLNAATGVTELTLDFTGQTIKGFAVDDARSVFWILTYSNVLMSYDFAGNQQISIGVPAVAGVDFVGSKLLVDKRDGSIWVNYNTSLLKISYDGQPVLSVTFPNSFWYMDIDYKENTLWVAGSDILMKIDATTGTLKQQINVDVQAGPDGFPPLREIKAIDFDSYFGELWVIDNYTLRRYDRAGNLIFSQDIPDGIYKSSSVGHGKIWLLAGSQMQLRDRNGAILLAQSAPDNLAGVNGIVANVNDGSAWMFTTWAVYQYTNDGLTNLQTSGLFNWYLFASSGDINPPTLQIVNPPDGSIVSGIPAITFTYQDVGLGVDVDHPDSRELFINDVKVPITCTETADSVTCVPADIDLSVDIIAITLKLKDNALNESLPVSATYVLAKIAPVSGLQATQQVDKIQLQWSAYSGETNIQGFNIYRQKYGTTINEKLATVSPSTLTYTDDSVTNGTGYTYTVVAVDNNGNDGEAGAPVNIFLAYNTTGVSGISVAREQADARLNWGPAGAFRYRIYRGLTAESMAPLVDVDTTTYLDATALWNNEYVYQIATLADFTDLLGDPPETIVKEGPLSVAVSLPSLPPLGLSVDNARILAGSLELVIEDPSLVRINGRYTEAVGPVDITATSGAKVLTTTSNTGRYNFTLPVTSGTTWQLSVSEQTVADRVTTVTLNLINDSQAPLVSIDGNANRSIDADTIQLTGTVIDTGSGVAEVYSASSRYADQQFGAFMEGGGSFSTELPLEPGENILTAYARDKSGNIGQSAVIVTRAISQAPRVFIDSPSTGTVVYSNKIDVSGTIYSSLPADQIQISLGTAQQFATPTTTPGIHIYSIKGVPLIEGFNTLAVNVETPAGLASAAVAVMYDPNPPKPEEVPLPVISLTSPRTSYLNASSVIIAGGVSSPIGISGLSIADVPVELTGNSETYQNFQYEYSLAAVTDGQVSIDITATDTLQRTITKTLLITNDATAPVISLTGAGIQLPPAVNPAIESTYPLQGSISDSNLAGFTINGQNISLLPGASAGSYDFSVALALPNGTGQTISLEAWDNSGNRTSQDLLFDVDVPVDIEFITPRDGTELASSTAGTQIDVITRLTGYSAGQTVHLALDSTAFVPMSIDGNTASVHVSTPLNTGEHSLIVEVRDTLGNAVARRRSKVVFNNIDTVALQVDHTEPLNNAVNVAANEPITIYFNRAIDPALLSIEVKETVHGMNYDLSNQKGKSLGEIPPPELVEVHRDMEPVTGTLSHYPGNRYVSFNPARRYVYGADIYVTVIYDGAELARHRFKVKPLPTLVSGTVVDSLGINAGGIDISVPELDWQTRTGKNGSYLLHSEQAGKAVKSGRYRVYVNPDLKNPAYGTMGTWLNIESQRLNQMPKYSLPLLNRHIPYVQIQSGQAEAIVARGNMTLDLTNTTLRFPTGRNRGNVHIQFRGFGEFDVESNKGAIPQWLYGVQPSGIDVSGTVGISIHMPKLNGSHQYVPPNGTYVVMLGYNATADSLEPVGVGVINDFMVNTVSPLPMSRLDYIGYALVDDALQPILARYANGEIEHISLLISELEKAVGQ